MATPTLCSTTVRNESFAGVTYHLEGEIVPVLHVELGDIGVYFEHHVLLWKHPGVTVRIRPMAGAFKRMIAGMPVFMTEALAPGHIAFSRDGAGQILALHLAHGEGVDVREHQFLAATSNVDFTFQRVKGAANILLGGSGFFIDTFGAPHGDGILWLHGYGNVFEVTLGRGESIDVESGGWIYKDRTVRMETQYQRLTTSLLGGSGRLFWNRFTGPGRVGIQSMYVHMPAGR
ncbi:MAG TPA: AIM24 family protein [Gemmatimonadaceae bacterium]|nr:AIM24 family protein [Gemmatimonadaceae bacterium]